MTRDEDRARNRDAMIRAGMSLHWQAIIDWEEIPDVPREDSWRMPGSMGASDWRSYVVTPRERCGGVGVSCDEWEPAHGGRG